MAAAALQQPVAPALPAGAADAAGPVPPPCLIVNPRSFRASRGLAQQAIALARARGADVAVVDDPAALAAAVDGVLARRQSRVAVLAGDGTVQAIVEQLSGLPPRSWTPTLLLLPGGRSNLSAADLGPRGDALASLGQALERAAARRWDEAAVERRALRIEQDGARPRHGFFLCGALIDSAIRDCHAYRAAGSGASRQGRFSTLWWLLVLARRTALGGGSCLDCPALSVQAAPSDQTAPAARQPAPPGDLQGRMRVLLVTTLEHRSGLFNPYAARGQGALRLTAVTANARRFWGTLPRLLTQRLSPAMDTRNGYLSGRFDRIRIAGLSRYSLDGETVEADPDLPLVVTPGPRLRFLAA